MRLNLFVRLLLLVLVTSCSSNKSSEIQIEVPSVKASLDNPQVLRASDFFEEITYVPLETSDDFLLGYIGRMAIQGNSIYMMSGKSIYVFDLETGKGKLNISKLGSGPGEYKSLFDFIVDKKTSNIELLDNNGKKVFVYDSNGKYLRSLDLPFMPFSFCKQTDNLYSFYNSNLKSEISSTKIVDYNVELHEKTNEYFPIDDKLAEYFFLGDEKVFSRSSESLFCHISPVDTIYKFEENVGFVPVYHLDFLNHAAPNSFYNERYRDIMVFSEAANKNEYIYALSNFAINANEDILFSYRLGKTFYWTLRFGMKKECTTNNLLDDYNFMESLPLTYHNVSYCLDDDYLYFLMSGEQFVELCDKGVVNENIKQLKKNAEITEQSNPIVVKCKLKKN